MADAPAADAVPAAAAEEELGALEPGQGFDAARAAAANLHIILNKLKDDKTNASTERFTSSAQELQQQLLALRRSHRAMVKMAEAGRTLETAARRAADAEYAHLETRQYESACCRAAARRCRNLPTPQLNQLRPLMEGCQEEDENEETEGAEVNGKSGLAAQLEVERLERTRLSEELEGLEKSRRKELEGFREREKLGAELTSKLSTVDRALEPVCDLLELRPRSGMDEGMAAKLSAPLRLVYSKFEALGEEGGAAVTIQESGAGSATSKNDDEDASAPPPEKRPRVEAPDAGQLMVCVKVTASSTGQAAVLQFTNPCQSLVTVAVEGGAGDALLEELWPEDDGRNGAVVSLMPSAEMDKGGRPYAWAQVLAGLREEALAGAPALHSMESVAASDVVSRVQAKLSVAPAASPEAVIS